MKVLSLFDGKYEITSDGKVFSNIGKRKELVGKTCRTGYKMVVLTVNGKKLYPNIHRLVAEKFIPNPHGLREVNHVDGNKLNNREDNLEWVSSKDNLLHARDSGLLSTTKINMDIANEIRGLSQSENYTHRQLGEMFGIKKTQVGYILQNKRWCI